MTTVPTPQMLDYFTNVLGIPADANISVKLVQREPWVDRRGIERIPLPVYEVTYQDKTIRVTPQAMESIK